MFPGAEISQFIVMKYSDRVAAAR